MKAVLTNSKTGQIAIHEIPTPELLPSGILVQTHFSVISSGTERTKIETGEKSLLGKARARPDLVRQVIDVARSNGIRAAYQKVQARLGSLLPIGYSCSGTVLEVGKDVVGLRPGDRVACAGAGYANHSEVNYIPCNLAVRVPDAVPLEHAAITTIGAIAIQGLRQAQISFGETVVVIGVGLIGMLTVQLARAAGCHVVAVDVNEGRVKHAVSSGARVGFLAGDPRLPELVAGFSRRGADVALVTAATHSSEPLELSTKLLRDRGRIVIVGDVGLDVARNLLYSKELSVTLSRSYGPGRYDSTYEEDGIDYPIGYVRWTEQRNMEAFVDYLSTGAVDVTSLLELQRPLEEAPQAYDEIRQNRAYTVLLRYPQQSAEKPPSFNTGAAPKIALANQETLGIGCLGAGGFALGTIFPYLRKIRGAKLEAVATATGVAAESARKSAGFQRTATPADLIADPGIDALFVLTRHDSHARYVIAAVENGKPVFIEKPLCVAREEFDAIREVYCARLERNLSPFVMVGFNRRFAPFTGKIRDFFGGHREPMVINIRVNAGFISRDHWAQQVMGGRIVGELCHFIDLARYIVGQTVVSISAAALPDQAKYNRDNLSAMLLFADGSIANIVYLANGDRSVPKELFEVFCEGGVARLDDFRTLTLIRGGKTKKLKSLQDKGHRNELELTVAAMRSGLPAPISFDEICEVTETSFRIEEAVVKPFGGNNCEETATENKFISRSGSNSSGTK